MDGLTAGAHLDFSYEVLAGVPGFEPGNDGTKNRCLTTWLHPNKGPDKSIVRMRGRHHKAFCHHTQ